MNGCSNQNQKGKGDFEMRVSPHVVVISGTPGTGKTAVAKQLARSLEAEYLSVGEYVQKRRLFQCVDRSRGSKVVDVVAAGRSLRRQLTASKELVIVDTHRPEAIIPSKLAKLVVVLRCHPRTLEGRLRAKGWRRNKIRENVLAEILDSCLLAAVGYYGRRKVVQVDTTKVSLRTCVVAIRGIAVGTRSRTIREVDWLARLDREGLLGRYLK